MTKTSQPTEHHRTQENSPNSPPPSEGRISGPKREAIDASPPATPSEVSAGAIVPEIENRPGLSVKFGSPEFRQLLEEAAIQRSRGRSIVWARQRCQPHQMCLIYTASSGEQYLITPGQDGLGVATCDGRQVPITSSSLRCVELLTLIDHYDSLLFPL